MSKRKIDKQGGEKEKLPKHDLDLDLDHLDIREILDNEYDDNFGENIFPPTLQDLVPVLPEGACGSSCSSADKGKNTSIVTELKNSLIQIKEAQKSVFESLNCFLKCVNDKDTAHFQKCTAKRFNNSKQALSLLEAVSPSIDETFGEAIDESVNVADQKKDLHQYVPVLGEGEE